MVKWWPKVNFMEQTLMLPEIIPFHAAFAMNALSRRFVNAAAFPFIYFWNCLGVLCCPSFVNCSLVKYVREHWTTYSMSCKYVKWTSLFLFNRSTFFDNKKSSKLVKDVDCLSDWEVSNGGESEGRVKEKGQRIINHLHEQQKHVTTTTTINNKKN